MYVDCNKAFLDLTGLTREEVIGHSSIELNIWADPEDRRSMVDTVIRQGACRNFEVQFRKKNGQSVWGLMSASMIELEGMVCVLTITRDVSDAKTAEDEIRHLAFYDPLTDLANRRLLLERLRQTVAASLRSGRRQALLFVDLDNFKTLNDTVGHHVGDLLLKEAGRRLSSCIRAVDTASRVGGDEFVVILGELSRNAEEAASQATTVAEKILASLNEPYALAGRLCASTASIGITVFGQGNDNTTEILQQADIAMYRAKQDGRAAIRFFEPELQSAVNARAELEERSSPRNSEPGIRAVVSAAGGRRKGDWRGGVAAVESSAAGDSGPGSFYCTRGGDGADCSAGTPGVGRGVRADFGMGREACDGVPDDGGECQSAAIPRRQILWSRCSRHWRGRG